MVIEMYHNYHHFLNAPCKSVGTDFIITNQVCLPSFLYQEFYYIDLCIQLGLKKTEQTMLSFILGEVRFVLMFKCCLKD